MFVGTRNNSLRKKLARMMAPLESDRCNVKISSRSNYRCAKGHGGVGFRSKSRPGGPLAEAQGRGRSWKSDTIPCLKN